MLSPNQLGPSLVVTNQSPPPQLSRLQGSLADSGPSPSMSALAPSSPRKTWSAPNKDPFGGEIQVDKVTTS